jgi:hypothetical protein
MDQMVVSARSTRSFAANETSDRYLSMAARLEARAAHEAPKQVYPDQYISIHEMTHREEVEVTLGDGSWSTLSPSGFEAVAGEYVLFDLDQLERRSYSPLSREGREEEARVLAGFREVVKGHPLFSGRMNVVETSKRGFQILLGLEVPLVDRSALDSFYASEEVRSVLTLVGSGFLSVVGRGGSLDPAVFAAGANGRLPGARVDKDGNFFIARLLVSDPRASRRDS